MYEWARSLWVTPFVDKINHRSGVFLDHFYWYCHFKILRSISFGNPDCVPGEKNRFLGLFCCYFGDFFDGFERADLQIME
jgi:hypothetical protein